jgi:chromosome segregation ATPase
MTSAPASPSSVEATTTLLQAELPRLEAHQQSLEKELAAVTERLESVRSALTALQALSGVPHVLQEAEEAVEAEEAATPAAEPVVEQVATVPAPRRSGGKKAVAKKRGAAKKPARAAKPAAAKPAAAKKSEERTSDKEQASGLTRQVLDILADAKGGTVRARDVAKVLGRDGSPGDINAVRSTLDRLVATSRADRAGRGLYRERA